jgi:hypoxanthine phosphoribosyltransferase
MSEPFYGYSTRKGLLSISWADFHGICKALARAAFCFRPEIVLPIGRGGYYPGTLIAHLLQTEVYPVRVSRRVRDAVTYDRPRWLVPPPPLVEGRRVLVVDEICSSGESLPMVKDRVVAMGAREARCAVLYAHSGGVSVPDYVGLVTDALLLNPWDREILTEDGFQFHPEYVAALAEQGMTPEPSLLIAAPTIQLAKHSRDE